MPDADALTQTPGTSLRHSSSPRRMLPESEAWSVVVVVAVVVVVVVVVVVNRFHIARILRSRADSLRSCCLVIQNEVLLYVHRNRRLIRDGSPGRPPPLSHSSWARVIQNE